MKRLLMRLLPERAAAQIAVIVVGSLLLANLVTAGVLLAILPAEFRRIPTFPYVTEFVTVAKMLGGAPEGAARAALFDAAVAASPRLSRLPPEREAMARRPPSPDRKMLAALREEIGGLGEVFLLDNRNGRSGPAALGLRFRDGLAIVGDPPPMLPPPRGVAFVGFLIAMVASLASLIGLLSLWAARAVASPLSRLAEAADGFDPDRDHAVSVEQGPVEVKRLASAFSAMAGRIRKLVEERTRMLAAVSHDLRTPITRLRLRAEEIADEDKRKAILADLALMERMVGGALSFLREGRASGSLAATDIPALLQTVCDDFADLGHVVIYEGPMRLAALCDADQMTRAVTNLVDNAIKFGGRAVVRLAEAGPDRIVVSVEDDGPGIAPEEREKVFEPFYRTDLARTLREDGGFGLGLAIVRAIAQAHRGDLTLDERPGGGLRASIAWPRRV